MGREEGTGIFERNLLFTNFQSTVGKWEVVDRLELMTGDTMVAALDQILSNSGQIFLILLFLLFLMAFFLS